MTRLFHVSDDAGITRFEPRRIGDGEPRVWAIDDAHLVNYLLPRDCPRVCFRMGPRSGPHDAVLLEGAAIIIAIETAWEERLRTGSVAVYEMPTTDFVLTDATAGYWQSGTAVTPLGMRIATSLSYEISRREARLLVLDTLWPLADRVRESALDFSLIRMRNAGPR